MDITAHPKISRVFWGVVVVGWGGSAGEHVQSEASAKPHYAASCMLGIVPRRGSRSAGTVSLGEFLDFLFFLDGLSGSIL